MKAGVIGAGCAASLVAMLLAPAASADCAMPVGYNVTVQGNTVTICPQNFDHRACPDADGMLRQDSNGNTVKLADFCNGDAGTACYVDECVPKGVYKYGFAKPYSCCSSCCGTDYYATASVTTDPPANCALSAGNAGTTPFTGTVPWTNSSSICSYSGSGGSGAAGGSAGTAGSTSGAAGSAGSQGSGGAKSSGSSNNSGGCTIRPPGMAERTVLGVDLLLAGAGLLLMGRRRRSRRR